MLHSNDQQAHHVMPCAKHTSRTAHLSGAQQTGGNTDLQASSTLWQ